MQKKLPIALQRLLMYCKTRIIAHSQDVHFRIDSSRNRQSDSKCQRLFLDLSDVLMRRLSRVQTAVTGDTDCYSEFVSHKITSFQVSQYNRRKSRVWFQLMMQCISTRFIEPKIRSKAEKTSMKSSESILGILWDAWWRHAQRMKLYRAIEHCGEKELG